MSHFLDYCATYPDAILKFHASDMKLWIHTDASYLCQPKLRSRCREFHFLGNKGDTTNLNGPIQIIAKVLRNLMLSAAETELAVQFNNAKEGVAEHITLEEMGHKQGKLPVISNNITAVGIANKTLKHKRSKVMAVKFLLDKRQKSSRSIQVHLATRKRKHRRSSHQKIPSKASQNNEANHPELSRQ